MKRTAVSQAAFCCWEQHEQVQLQETVWHQVPSVAMIGGGCCVFISPMQCMCCHQQIVQPYSTANNTGTGGIKTHWSQIAHCSGAFLAGVKQYSTDQSANACCRGPLYAIYANATTPTHNNTISPETGAWCHSASRGMILQACAGVDCAAPVNAEITNCQCPRLLLLLSIQNHSLHMTIWHAVQW